MTFTTPRRCCRWEISIPEESSDIFTDDALMAV